MIPDWLPQVKIPLDQVDPKEWVDVSHLELKIKEGDVIATYYKLDSTHQGQVFDKEGSAVGRFTTLYWSNYLGGRKIFRHISQFGPPKPRKLPIGSRFSKPVPLP